MSLRVTYGPGAEVQLHGNLVFAELQAFPEVAARHVVLLNEGEKPLPDVRSGGYCTDPSLTEVPGLQPHLRLIEGLQEDPGGGVQRRCRAIHNRTKGGKNGLAPFAALDSRW